MENKLFLGKNKLEEAIGRFESSYYDSFAEVSGEICHSERYRRKMKTLLNKNGASQDLAAKGGFKKRLAVILLASALLFAGVLGVSASKHSSAFTKWIEKTCERFTEIFFEQRDIDLAPLYIETLYLPTYIPDEYTLFDHNVNNFEARTVWENKSDEQILFLQMTMNSKTTLDHEDALYEMKEIDGIQYLVLTKNGKRCHYWSLGNYTYFMIVPEGLSKEESFAIIHSMETAEITPNESPRGPVS